MALCSSASATTLRYLEPVYPYSFHENEDYHSVPSPIFQKPMYTREALTSTKSKYLKNGTTDLSSETYGVMDKFFVPYNKDSVEPKAKTLIQMQEESDSESDSEEDDFEKTHDNVTVLW